VLSKPGILTRLTLSKITIRRQILFGWMIALMPVATLAFFHIHNAMEEAQKSLGKVALAIAQVNAAEISRTLAVTETFLEKLSRNPDIQSLNPTRCGHLFDHFPEISPNHANLLTKNSLGQPICSALPIPEGSKLSLQTHIDDTDPSVGLRIGTPYLGPLSHRWVLPIDYPLRNQDGKIIGAISAPLDLLKFNPFVGEGAFEGLPEGTTATLFDADMTMLARSKNPEKWIGSKRVQNPELTNLVAQRSGTTRFPSLIDGIERIHGAAPIPKTNWTTVASIPSALLDEKVRALVNRWIEVGVLALAASALIAAALAGQTARPFLAITKAAESVKKGDLEARALPAGSVEAVDLAQAFNSMLDELKEKQWELALSEDRYRSLFLGSKLAMILVDAATGAIVDANRAAASFYGWDVEALKQMNITQINVLTSEQIAAEMALAKEEKRTHFHFRHQLKNGQIREVEVHSGPFSLGARTCLLSIIHDETERRRLEQERQRSEQIIKTERLRSQMILKTASDGIHILDRDGKLIEANDAFLTMLGYDETAIGKLTVADWDAAYSWEIIKSRNDDLILRRGKAVFETRHRRRDGTLLDVEINASGMEIDGEGYLYAASRDISERKRAEQQLRIAASVFEAQEGMMVTDADSVILRVNRAFAEITGYTSDEVVGRKTSLLKSGRHEPAFYQAMWESLCQTGSWQGEIWNRRKNGEVYPQWLTITAVSGEANEISHYVATLADITLRKAAEDRIRHLAFYDPLTKLPNRRLLLDRLKKALATSSRNGREGALLFIDLDNFKALNDTLGHAIGDLLLQKVSERLLSCVREGDTVARLGGDEFVIMLEDLSSTQAEAATQTEAVAEKVLVELNQPYVLGDKEHLSTPSIGATLFSRHQDSIEELLKRADLAMYQAKAAGRNTVRFFDPDMQATVAARVSLENDLRQGIKNQQFCLYFQPQVDSRFAVTGAEALLRWQHPQRGLVAPAEFIPIAEDTGLIVPLGNWVLQTACAKLVTWANDPVTAKLSLAVNVSARQFRQADFAEQVAAVLAQTGANPHRLKLELTESLLAADLHDVIAKMSALQDLGVRFSLDDFGTGYSSLSYLKRLPLNQLKIDKSFVSDLLVDSHDGSIAQAVIALGQSMGLEVIAEGVETMEQCTFLARLGCQAFQGYLFGKPVADFGQGAAPVHVIPA